MNRHVNGIANSLSLRNPQRQSLEILDRITEIVPLTKDSDREAALAAIRSEFKSVTDFEREFPSLCFALATGVGKTRLMGAFVSYLHLAHGIKNFFVLAPNLTIYTKLITDFTPNTPKYVFRGVQGFAIDPPVIITGDTYPEQAASLFNHDGEVKINIFNISKINSEVRGGKSPKIKKMIEYLGQPYFEYLAGLTDLVLLMDESHRYRASAGVRAINELKPILGLELTATPFTESPKGPVAFKNVVYDYALGRALEDGLVKEPAVVTRKDFSPVGLSADRIEEIKLEDGVRMHESVKVELATYANNANVPVVKPFVLVIARDITHAKGLLEKIEAETFFNGRYKGRVIQVDSSKTGAEEEKMIGELLTVEKADNPVEIVIHVNMLKEGWDVTNLYTIIPLRAANARTLVEQSIGRGLRLPYGKRVRPFARDAKAEDIHPVDRLNIIAHDKFQEIVDDARKMDSPIQLKYLILNPDDLERPTVTIVSKSVMAEMLEPPTPVVAPAAGEAASPVVPVAAPMFTTEREQKAAQTTFDVIHSLQSRPAETPTMASLLTPKNQEKIVAEVRRKLGQVQGSLIEADDVIAQVVAKTTEMMVKKTIDIPRISVVPAGEVKSGYHPFSLDLSVFRQPVPTEDLWVQSLRGGHRQEVIVGGGGIEEKRLEDYIVSGLVDFDDISYDEHTADLLFNLADQVVKHFRNTMNYSESDIHKVLRMEQKQIAANIHSQMEKHHWVEQSELKVIVNRGFTELKPSAYTASAHNTIHDLRQAPAEKSKIAQYVYAGFQRCLYSVQKFQADNERIMAIILERDSIRWFRPARGQFQLLYRYASEEREYLPDFVAEVDDAIYMIETKAVDMMDDAEVLLKQKAGVGYCREASVYSLQHGGKRWEYLKIPHNVIAENRTLADLAQRFGVVNSVAKAE